MSDPLDDMIVKASAEEQKSGQLRSSLAFGLMQNPDQRAKAQQVAGQLGTTPQAAQDNLSNFERAAQRNAFDFEGFIKHTPKLATWTAEPEHAAVAHDDMDSLKELEHAIQDRPKGVSDSQWQSILDDRIRIWQENKGKNEVQSGVQNTLNRWFGLATGVASWAAAPLSMLQQVGGMANKIVAGHGIDNTLREGPGDVFGDTISGGLKRLGEAQNQTMGQQYVKTGPQRMLVDKATGKPFINPDSNEIFNRDLLNTVEGMPADLLGMWMTGGMLGGKTFPAYMAADAMENRAKAAAAFREAHGLAPNSIRDYSEGAVSGALNWFLMTGVPHAVPTRTLLGDALQKTARAAVLGPSLNAAENLLAGAHGESKPMTEGAVKSFIHFLPWELQSTLPRLIDAASTSKLKARAPEAFQRAADTILKDSGIEQVMIPADRFTAYFQDTLGQDPIQVAERLGVRNYAEAVAAGTDVVIPTADFLAKLKPEDHHGLLPDLRTQVGSLTAREAEAYQAEAAKVDLKATVEPAEAGPQRMIYEETRAQLLDAGNSERVADILADRHSRVMVNLAKDFGQDPLTMNERFGLRIYRPAPGEGQTAVDISLGRMGGADPLAVPEEIYSENPEMDPVFWQSVIDGEPAKPNLKDGAVDGRQTAGQTEGPIPGAGSGEVPESAGRVVQRGVHPHWIPSTRTWGGSDHLGPEPTRVQGDLTELAPDPRLQDYQRRNIPVLDIGGIKVTGGPRPPYFSFHGNELKDGSPILSTSTRSVGGEAVYVAQRHADASKFMGEDGQNLALYTDTSKLVSFDGRGTRIYTPEEARAFGIESDGPIKGSVLHKALVKIHGGGKGLSDFLKGLGFNGMAYDLGGVAPAWAVFDPRVFKNVSDTSSWTPEEVQRREAFDPTPLGAGGVQIEDNQKFYQPAYHGSPYRFDQFTLDHIGKGEGVAAYGWGLYFAGNKSVAEYYRKSLSSSSDMASYTWNGKRYEARSGPEAHALALSFHESPAVAKKIAKGGLADVERGDPYALEMGKEYWQKMLDTANAIKSKREVKQDTGQVYKVDIPDSGYLMWDKPLKEQADITKKVSDLLKSDAVPDRALDDFDVSSREELAQKLLDPENDGNYLYGSLNDVFGSDKDASEALNSVGIPGIKYLDGNSRGVGKGEFNYVIFDAKAVDTLETFYQPEKRVGWAHRYTGKRYASADEKMSARMSKLSRRSGASIDKAKEAWILDEQAAAKAREDEFLAWEAGVKEVQAGDIMSDNRGFIQFSPDRKVSIALLEKADLSTFTHEVGHMYLEVMGDLATAEGAAGPGVESYQKVLDYLGVGDRSELTRDHHEKFARAMEAYAMEGKAPTPELKGAFQRVKFWMMQVYRSISDLGVKLSPEIRGVFDRMFAGEDAVRQAQNVVDLKPIFATPEAMGATQAEFDAYSKAAAKAIGTAREAVESKLIRELKREKESWWKAEAAKVAEEVTAEVEADPVHQAFKALTEGKLEDGTPIKLNKDALEDQFGYGVGKELPRGWLRLYTREGGMDAEAAAEILGFPSGDQLIESLKAMEPKKQAIKRITEERMKAQHGDMMTDGSLADAAVEALHNSAREDMLMAELRILRKKAKEMGPALELKALKTETAQQAKDREALGKAQGQMDRLDRQQARAATEVPPIQAFRDAARELVDQTSIRDLQPYSYLVASRKAAREAFAAMAKDDYQVAGDAKQKELLNHHLYLEATKARDEAAGIAEYGKKGETAKFQARLGKAGGDYLGQWNALASRYEFRKVTNQELDARAQSLEAWATAQQAVGEGIVVDPALYREDQVKNWREVPIAELRAVHDALKNIETVARRQRQVLDGNKKADYEAAVDELQAGAFGNLKAKPLPLDPLARSAMDKAVSIAKGLNTGIVKMERVIDHLDQGDISGPWRRYIFEPMALAQFKEYELNQKVTKSLADAIEAMPKDQRHSMLDIYDIPGMGRVTRKFILSMAMNWGNAGNREKLIKGMGWTSTPEVVVKAFDKLNRADWEFVQKTWDAIDQLWPEIADLQKRMTGVEPPRVEREAFTVNLPDGSTVQMDGGYYPLVYDRTKSSQGAMQADNDIMNSEGGFNGPVTFKGHTKERVANFAAPLNLDFEQVLIRHTSSVIKDLSHREAALSVAKLIKDQRVRQAISETMGPEYDAMLMPWLKGTVNDLGGQMGADAGTWKNLLMTTRSNMVLAGLSFRAGSILVQATDLGRAMTKVAPRHLGQALLDFGAHPIQTTEMVRGLSKEMLGRSENLDRDTRAMMKRTQGQDGWMHNVQKVGMEGLAWADTITSVTTWLGAYRQAQAEGKAENQAIREADRTVRMTMMSSAPKDLVAVQRVGDVGMKFITMFMGDATSAYGTMNEGVRQIAMGKDTGSHLFKMAMVGMVLPILGQLIKNRGPRDDEDKAWWATKNALLSLPSSIPIARDIAQSLDSGQDYKFTPVANAIDKAVKSVRLAGKMTQGKAEWDDVFMHAFDAAGTLGGLPGTSQVMTSTNYLRDVKKGKKPAPKNSYEAIKNTLFGPPPKGK